MIISLLIVAYMLALAWADWHQRTRGRRRAWEADHPGLSWDDWKDKIR